MRNLRTYADIIHGAPETQPLLLFTYACIFPKYPTGCSKLMSTLRTTYSLSLPLSVEDEWQIPIVLKSWPLRENGDDGDGARFFERDTYRHWLISRIHSSCGTYHDLFLSLPTALPSRGYKKPLSACVCHVPKCQNVYRHPSLKTFCVGNASKNVGWPATICISLRRQVNFEDQQLVVLCYGEVAWSFSLISLESYPGCPPTALLITNLGVTLTCLDFNAASFSTDRATCFSGISQLPPGRRLSRAAQIWILVIRYSTSACCRIWLPAIILIIARAGRC